jgi:DNA topoisomerase-1
VIASLPRNANPDTFSLAEALPLLAAQRDKGKKRGRKTSKSASAKAASAKAAKNGAATEVAKKTKTAKKTGLARKTAATKTSVGRSTAKTSRTRSGPAPR